MNEYKKALEAYLVRLALLKKEPLSGPELTLAKHAFERGWMRAVDIITEIIKKGNSNAK